MDAQSMYKSDMYIVIGIKADKIIFVSGNGGLCC